MKRDDLTGHLSLEGVKKKLVGLVINNGKMAKKGKPKLAFTVDEIAVKLIEVLMSVNLSYPKMAYLLDNTAYAHYKKISKVQPGTMDCKVHA